MHAVLIAENEEDMEFLAFLLRQMGLSLLRHTKLTAVSDFLAQNNVNLILVAQENPAVKNIATLRELSQAPVLLLIEEATEAQQCAFLDAGVDLILKRPYSPRILKRYIRNLVQRAASVPVSVQSAIQAGDVSLDPETHSVQVKDGAAQRLTSLEFRLLTLFITNPNHVIPLETIIEHVWGYDGDGDKELVRGLVRRLRRKIEPIPKEPQYIHNLPGIGYQFVTKDEG